MAKPEIAPEQPPELSEPVGFTQADTDVDNYPAWDFEKQGELRGSVQKVKTVTLIRRGEEQDVRLAVVVGLGGELVILWESANLGDFFDKVQPGHEIVVQPVGSQMLAGNRVMKLYRAYYR